MGSLRFSTTAHTINRTGHADFVPEGAVTMAIWANIAGALGGWPEYWRVGGAMLGTPWGNSYRPSFSLATSGGNVFGLSNPGTALTHDQWYWVTGTWASGGGPRVVVYTAAGGVQYDSTPGGTATGTLNVDNARIGGKFTSQAPDARFRHAMCWDAVLTDAEILASRFGRPARRGSLLIHWDLDGLTTGSTEPDITGNGYAGTIAGSPGRSTLTPPLTRPYPAPRKRPSYAIPPPLTLSPGEHLTALPIDYYSLSARPRDYTSALDATPTDYTDALDAVPRDLRRGR